MQTQLIHFDKARQALAEAHSIDEVKQIRDRAEAMRQYIKRQKGGLIMQNQAAEIKIRAERRAGEMLGELPKDQGVRRDLTLSIVDKVIIYSDVLRENDLAPATAKRWEIEASVPEEQLEQFIAEATEKAEEITSRAVLSMAMKIKNEAKKEPTSDETIPSGLFEVIVIDPPWPYGSSYNPQGHRVASPYDEMNIEDIMVMEIPATENCILWLWTTNKFMHEAYHILEAWAFEPKGILTWFKEQTGVGYWLRGQTEHCLLAVKGKPTITHVAQGTAIREKARGHSQKPEVFYQLVESLCPGKKLVMYQRGLPRAGWEAHGNQRI